MKLTPEQLYIYTLAFKFYNDICEHIGFKEEYRFEPGGGQWVIDFYDQMQTAYRIAKGNRMSVDPNQGPAVHADTKQLPPLPNYDRPIEAIPSTAETTKES